MRLENGAAIIAAVFGVIVRARCACGFLSMWQSSVCEGGGKMKKRSGEIALSAVACALSTLGLTVGTLYSPMLFTGYLLACLCMFLPLSQRYYKGALLCFLATNVLTLLFNGFNFFDLLPYTVFFGLHPLVNEWQTVLRGKNGSKKIKNMPRQCEEDSSQPIEAGNLNSEKSDGSSGCTKVDISEDPVIDWDEPVSRETAEKKETDRKTEQFAEKKKKIGIIDVIFILFKICWFDAAMYFIWKVVFSANTAIPFLDAHILPVILIGGSLFFLVYDALMFRLRKNASAIISRYIRRK